MSATKTRRSPALFSSGGVVPTEEGFAEFQRKYPDSPTPEPLDRLSLPISRENAEKILSGEKTVEFREFKEHYGRMVLDKKVMKWREDNDAILSDEDLAYADPIRQVRTIHFYDYNKTFTLDVTLKETGIICVNEADVKMLQERFGCHEQDANLAMLDKEAVPDEERPLYLYFAIDHVIGTNLR